MNYFKQILCSYDLNNYKSGVKNNIGFFYVLVKDHRPARKRWSALRSPIWDFYNRYPTMSVCRTCNSVLRGSRINSNAKYHLKALHPDKYQIFLEKRGHWLNGRRVNVKADHTPKV